jgi:hypothetical protein
MGIFVGALMSAQLFMVVLTSCKERRRVVFEDCETSMKRRNRPAKRLCMHARPACDENEIYLLKCFKHSSHIIVVCSRLHSIILDLKLSARGCFMLQVLADGALALMHSGSFLSSCLSLVQCLFDYDVH